MSLSDWHKNGWLRTHIPSASEVAQLIEVANRDLRDCDVRGLSEDWRFGISYNAALQLAHVALIASGYETPKGESHHFRTIESLEHTISADGPLIRKFNAFRKMRNAGVYERAGVVSRHDADEKVELAKDLRKLVVAWLAATHPNLIK
jgi:hypothetical protein